MHSDIVYHLRASHAQLSATERKVADAILDDIAFAAAASIDQLADKAGVSMATISRFAKAVNCSDIRDLKRKLAQAGAVGSRFLADQLPNREEHSFYTRICNDIEQTLHRNLAGFSEAQFRAATGLLSDARMIYIAGMGGGSTMLADELQFRLARLGFAVAAYHDPVLLRMMAATMTPQDALLILSVSGVTPELQSAADIAREYGARIVVITDPASPLASRADVLLPLQHDETDFIYKPSASRYAMLLAIDILATELALSRRDSSKDLLRRVKLALDDYRGGDNRLPLGD
ncbi:transcriptional regulator, RpiR family [Andreprevotia lacus DSM 23236]|jgi:DNA-binding MurR/RpiR family transcriptional regulator|uniref:Transcriptional regulator, RpiR family n=1 Tax=Andreprevotia lacus DSM 23236 TaxID=1121001 RepID=A0A1W1XVK8_9NEIS|nr:MurR/RpiR family transcriptional regulator [Andreprevotia lacus]SMC27907.1 transcriptional regulator, RpiR family [Andreprevotia lacus DSM 23236]